MEVFSAIKKRRSIRDYQDRAISEEAVETIIDAARFAPTARGVQPWEFVVVTEPMMLKKLSALAENGRFIAGAKVCIAVCSSDTKYYLEDGCAATQNILLAATALGIGSCWVAGDKKPYSNQVLSLLNAPANFKLVSLISLGYPQKEDSFRLAERRGLKEVLHWGKF